MYGAVSAIVLRFPSSYGPLLLALLCSRTASPHCPCLQGEMSATVLRFPNSYAAIQQRLRKRIHGGKGDISRVRVGVSKSFC